MAALRARVLALALRLAAPLVHALYRVALLLRLGVQLAERDLHAGTVSTDASVAAKARLLSGESLRPPPASPPSAGRGAAAS